MLAFDSLYHSRAWVMLFLNVLQLLFSIVCLTQGTSFGASDILSWHFVYFSLFFQFSAMAPAVNS